MSPAALAAHVEALAEPRNAFVQPAALASAGDYIDAELRMSGYAPSRQPVEAQGASSANIIAELQGTSCPEKMIIAGAHYDTVAESPGAVDNASGVAATLEIARAMAREPLPLSVQFVFFTMEEDGLLGSEAMAAELAAENADVALMLSLDMVGYTTPEAEFIFVQGDDATAPFVEGVRTAGARQTPALEAIAFTVGTWPSIAQNFRNSDHEPFWSAGYRAVQVTNSAERMPFFHAEGDLPATVDTQFTSQVATAVAEAMAMWAVCPGTTLAED